MTRQRDGSGRGKQGKERSQAKQIVLLVAQTGVELFHNETGKAYARVAVNGHFEVWPCKSEQFKDWLAKLLWTSKGKAPSSEAINTALNIIRAKARFEGVAHRLHNRVAWHSGDIWYDLADSQWRAVRITDSGYEIIAQPPILFRRYAHQQPQTIEPDEGRHPTEVLRFLNIKDPEQGLLLVVWLVTCLIPDIGHPVLVLHGPQGSAKTTAFHVLRKLIDPSVIGALDFPRRDGELIQQLSHHWAAFYDNVDTLPPWVSNIFCRTVTGEGSSKRELYSDDDDVIYSFRHCLGLNSINVAAQRADLLDRSLILELDRIDEGHRRREEDLWAEFEEIRPGLFSSMLNALSWAVYLRKSIQISALPRMADFCHWGCAIAEALGWTSEKFLEASRKNESLRNEEVLQSNALAQVIVKLVEEQGCWEGTSSSLFKELESVAEESGISTKSRDWPRSAISLSKRLKRITTNLAAAGIEISRDRNARQRQICIR